MLKQEFSTLPPGTDPESLFHLFRRHRLFPLSEEVRKQLPPAEGQQWKEFLQQKTFQSLTLFSETVTLVKKLESSGITALPLKGSILALALYGDVGRRHSNDIDLLVEPSELDRTIETLKQCGYTVSYPGKLTAKQQGLYRRYRKDVGLYNRERKIFVELHYGIYVHELLKREVEKELIHSTGSMQAQNTSITVLDRETTFIYLMYHGCLHQYFRLFWLRDVAECLDRWELDHGRVLQLALRLGFGRILAVSLLLAGQYFPVNIPAVYRPLLSVQAKPARRLMAMVHRRINAPEETSLHMKILRHRFLLALKPGLRYKWAVLWSIRQRKRIAAFSGNRDRPF